MKTAHAVALTISLVLTAGCTYYQNHPGYSTVSSDNDVIHSPSSGVTTTTPDFYGSDTPLARSVRHELRNNPKVAASAANVEVTEEDGIVTLSGVVPSEEQKSLIENLAGRTPGVGIVNDDLVVGLDPTGRVAPIPGKVFNLHVQGLSAPDRALAQRILDGLRTDTDVPPLLPVVNIQVLNGVVILDGVVQNDQQRQAIISDAQRAAGAENVVDKLRLELPH